MDFLRRLFGTRAPGTTLPPFASPVAHLIGPGNLQVRKRQLKYAAAGGTVALHLDGLEELLLYGRIVVSPRAWGELAARRTSVAWLDRSGTRLVARLSGPWDRSAEVRRRQATVLDNPPATLILAREVVAAKLTSHLAAARHYQRQGRDVPGTFLEGMAKHLERAAVSPDLAALRGIEGMAAREWFSLLRKLIGRGLPFGERSRRPPKDPVNSLLSFGYSLLLRKAQARVEAAGLEPCWGALHALTDGRPSLACDLAEPLRTPAVDRLVIGLVRQGHIKPADFLPARADGGVFLRPELLPKVTSWLETWFGEQKVPALLDGQVASWKDRLRQMTTPT